MNKPGAWEAYEKKTKEVADELEEIINQNDATMEQVMNKLEGMENKIKYATFGKTRKVNPNRKISKDRTVKNCEDVLKRQSEQMEKEIIR